MSARVIHRQRDYRRLVLPYGKGTCDGGHEVLFNRWYEPLWHRRPGEAARPAHPREWVPYAHQEWFYDDGTQERTKRRRGPDVLAAWSVPIPTTKDVRAFVKRWP